MDAYKPLLIALGRFFRGFVMTFLTLFVMATVVSLLANALHWPSFAVGAGDVSLYAYQAGTDGMLGVGAFHISMFVGLVSGALTFLKGGRK
ncbi:MAG: hypothetical protein ACM3XN_08670 [Chloroflexota bacterium]